MVIPETETILPDEELQTPQELFIDWFGDSNEFSISLTTLDEYLNDNQSLSQQVIDVQFNQLYQKAKKFESIYLDLQDFSQQMAIYACICAAHYGIDISGDIAVLNQSTLSGVGFMSEHEDHDHCKCGGHYDKFGRCSDCGLSRL